MCEHDGLDWEDIALVGALAEEMTEAGTEAGGMFVVEGGTACFPVP
jgi:hypothetical protein